MCTSAMIDFIMKSFLENCKKKLLGKLYDKSNKLDQIRYVNEQYPNGFQK